MYVVVGADRADHARTGGGGDLEGGLGLAEDAKDIGEVFEVEGDAGRFAVHQGVHFSDIVTDFFGAGGDGHFAGGQFCPGGDDQPYDAAAVTGKNG